MDPSGALSWSAEYGVRYYSSDGDIWGRTIAVDPEGFVYSTGHAKNTAFGRRCLFLVKYDAAGNLQWGKSTGYYDTNTPRFIRFKETNVFVSTDRRMFQFTAAGTQSWTSAQYTGDALIMASLANAMIDSSNRAWVAHTAWYTETRYAISKMDTNGTFLINTRLETDPPNPGNEFLTGACMDEFDNLYLVGSWQDLCLDPNGQIRWESIPANGEQSIVVHPAHDLFVVRSPFIVECRTPSPDDDLDRDGLPNGWEQDYFGDLTAAAPGGDDDQDGFNNLEEYVGQTSPGDSNSVPPLLQWVDNELMIDPAVTGRVYFVLRNSNFVGGSWTEYTNQTGTGTALFFDPDKSTEQGLFRFGIRLP